MISRQSKSVTLEILRALVPYSNQSFKLAFKPRLFFNDLENITKAKRSTLRSTYSRAINKGYIVLQDECPTLSAVGKSKFPENFRPPLLKDWLIVAFDIPESQRHKRYELRKQLKLREFQQLQKSVWRSNYDYGHEINDLASTLRISNYVSLLYATPLTD